MSTRDPAEKCKINSLTGVTTPNKYSSGPIRSSIWMPEEYALFMSLERITLGGTIVDPNAISVGRINEDDEDTS